MGAARHGRGGELSRRRFAREVALRYGAAVGVSGTLAVPRFGRAEDSGPIDCGPPPPAQAQGRTGGESFPPLPLPVTPLRRTEKKRTPAPPALIGKMALGPIRYVVRDGQRVGYRDWMTDPADLDSLLAWTYQTLSINISQGRGRLRPLLLRPPRAAGAAVLRPQRLPAR
ncbi:MAG TPA: hypothetical protein VF590_27450 [Isosphaeraceae bacterium]|jgi:hypothetical protein